MKRKLISVVTIVAVATVAGYNTYLSQNETKLSDLFLSDIEALANSGEGGGESGSGSTSGVSCYCGKIYGSGCKSDNKGSRCNPEGSSDCWSYDRNCS